MKNQRTYTTCTYSMKVKLRKTKDTQTWTIKEKIQKKKLGIEI